MPTTLTFSGASVGVGPRTLVSGLDLVVTDGDVTALVGPNGSGKSSLMRAVVGELPLESGSLRLSPSDATVGWMPQVTPDPAETLLGYARRRTGVDTADHDLEAAADALAAGREGAESAYATALDRWQALGAADLEDRLPQVTARVGLLVDPRRPLGSLSGGEAARATLVAVLLSRYDVLLLDEPTNDLDARGLGLVAEFVAGHPGPVLLASHDRAFLDEVATAVVELDLPQQRIGHYAGGWSDYVTARELDRRHAQEAFEEYADARHHLLAQARQRSGWADNGRRDVARGGEPDKHLRERFKARADRQDGRAGRLRKAIDRLDVVEQPRKEWELRYSLDAGSPSADVVAVLSGAEVVRGPFHLGPVHLTVARGDRVAVLGDNGSGKSTMIGALLGEVPLAAGTRTWGARVRLGVLDQRRCVLETDRPVADVVGEQLGGLERADVRTLLAKFGLGADHVDRSARTLSMGERTRAMMAVFQALRVNLLVLDEPTNHLDVRAIEQLEAALAAYEGTLLLVSHDERFLQRVGTTRRITVTEGAVVEAQAGQT